MNFVHGHAGKRSRSPTYRSWEAMRRRCLDANHAEFHRYGGRGIVFCERWKDFTNFLADMGARPDGTTLDRVDNDGNYEPSNCRWATRREQYDGISTNRTVVAGGVVRTLSQWARLNGIHKDTIRSRLKSGWNPVDAVSRAVAVRASARSRQ